MAIRWSLSIVVLSALLLTSWTLRTKRELLLAPGQNGSSSTTTTTASVTITTTTTSRSTTTKNNNNDNALLSHDDVQESSSLRTNGNDSNDLSSLSTPAATLASSQSDGSNNKNVQTVLSSLLRLRSPPRPQHLRLVFLGDSVTRYQYLSLAYFLRHGQWFDDTIEINNLVNSHSFHHPLHPNEDWNEFFLQSNRLLYPLEACDCLRSQDGDILVERRYFYDEDLDNMMVYINLNGNERQLGRGYYGRLDPTTIFGPNFQQLVGLPLGMNLDMDVGRNAIQWEFSTWGQVIRDHIGLLNFSYRGRNHHQHQKKKKIPSSTPHVLLNAGLHPHDFGDWTATEDVLDALETMHLPGTWKTTTYAQDYVLQYQQQQASSSTSASSLPPHVRQTDSGMCQELQRCFDLSWTAWLRPELYFDNLHFLEPVYRIINEEYLQQLGLLPQNYVQLPRSKVLTATNTHQTDGENHNDDERLRGSRTVRQPGATDETWRPTSSSSPSSDSDDDLVQALLLKQRQEKEKDSDDDEIFALLWDDDNNGDRR